MGNNLNFDYFYDKAAKLTSEAETRRKQADDIRHAIAVLNEAASNDNETGDVPLPIFEPANDNAATTPPLSPEPVRRTAGKGASKLADADLIDALTTRIQTPAQMVETLANMGINVSKGLIYQRMPVLADKLPDLIEATGKAWRIKSKAASDDASKVGKAASAARARKAKVRKVAQRAPVSPEPPTPIAEPPKPVAKVESRASARRPKATPKKSRHNPFASCAKLMASLLTNEWKSVSTLVSQARSYGWNGPSDLAARALDGLVRSGLASCRSTGGPVSYRRA